MKIPNFVHEQGRWVIRDIAHDFDLLDVWALPVEGGRDDFPAFLTALSAVDPITDGSLLSRALFRIRKQLGSLLNWDDPSRRIPAAHEESLAARLPENLRESAPPVNDVLRGAGAHPLYRIDDEAAIEISNDTVHGVLHLAWAEQVDGRYRAQMAIYVKPRGTLGRVYMKLIEPFRHLIVYPALMRQIERRWTLMSAAREHAE